MAHTATVSTVSQLLAAADDASIETIILSDRVSNAPTFRLAPGQSLEGADDAATINFASGAEGIQLSSDNRLRNLRLRVAPEQRAIYNDTRVESLGQMELNAITTTGRVQLLARDQVRGGHVSVNGLDIQAADARGERDRPHGYGVSVLQGAFTLWNMQPEDDVVVTADLAGISIGRDGAPALGSGVFVSGAGDTGGRLVARRLETEAIYSDGKIAPGTPDQITGGGYTFPGYFACAALAGLRSGILPQQDLTNLPLVGFSSAARSSPFFTESQLDTIAGAGVFIVTQNAAGAIYPRDGLTTNMTDTDHSSEMVITNFDNISYVYAQTLAPLIGQFNITPQSLQNLRTTINGVSNQLMNTTLVPRLGPQVVSANIVVLRQDVSDPATVVCVIDVALPVALKHLQITLVL